MFVGSRPCGAKSSRQANNARRVDKRDVLAVLAIDRSRDARADFDSGFCLLDLNGSVVRRAGTGGFGPQRRKSDHLWISIQNPKSKIQNPLPSALSFLWIAMAP
jgi:hypothetical protein